MHEKELFDYLIANDKLEDFLNIKEDNNKNKDAFKPGKVLTEQETLESDNIKED